jgi:ubiquinol-cytochrome c reductase cytochrome c subunit
MSRATHRPSPSRIPRTAGSAARSAAASVARRTRVTALALALLLSGASVPRAADTASAIAQGRQLYMAVGCWQCHGTVGQGGSAGPRLAPGPMPLEALRAFLRNSVRTMPAYPETILSDAAIADIHAYLQSIPAAPPADTLPLLRDLR